MSMKRTDNHESNMRRLQALQGEFLEICHGPSTTAAFLRLSELSDEMAAIHEDEAVELRRLAGAALDRAMFR